MRLGRWGPNLATLANALVGVGAVAYALAGNKLWAMLLIVAGIGFDGLDGWLHRRSGLPGGPFGVAADSVADAITFGLAPAVLVAVHPEHVRLWDPWEPVLWVAGLVLAGLAVARLTWFSLRAHHHPYFVGVPTPQTALGIVVALLWFDVPAFLGTRPELLLLFALVFAVAMVVPVRYPKIRRGSALRAAMTVTGVALVLALLPLQFSLPPGGAVQTASLLSTLVATIGVGAYYVLGPSTVARPSPGPSGAAP